MAKHQTTSTAWPACYAMVVPGLESVAEREIQRDVAGQIKKTSPGVVVFRMSPVDTSILKLRTVEDVFLFGWGTDQLSYRAEDLERIRLWTSREVDWDQLLRIHHAIRPKPRGKPTYRLVTQMIGTHGYRRTDARAALAKGLTGKLPSSWRHADENASVEIWLTIQGATAICGLRLSDRTMRHRTYKMEHIAASLRPTVAAAMVRLAEIKPGQMILDPLLGAGTILAEALGYAGRFHSPINTLGGDMDNQALRAASPNLRSLGQPLLARWDAGRLPLASHSVDRVVSNPPFGKQLSSPEEIGPLYKCIVGEMDRVVRPGGKIVLIVSDAKSLKGAAKVAGWNLVQQLRVRVLGQLATITVWSKPIP